MPRLPRLFLPEVPLHIVHRGHDRQPVFIRPRDYQYYLDNVAEAKEDLSVQLYAYCLMTNHVHLIVAPDYDATNISKFMRILAARQTRYVNKLENRTGTLWEGRFKASLIDSEAYLLACVRYVDLNPVRAAIVASPHEYRWSSFRSHATMECTDLVDDHPVFRALGTNSDTRGKAYREFVSLGIVDEEIDLIRKAIQRNQLTGNQQFQETIAYRTGRRIPARGRGRPGK